MSGADEQRAAERLRDAVICHCYDIVGPVGGGHWGSCLTGEIGDEVTAVLADRDRLRAELAETRAVLDRVEKLHHQADDDPGGPAYCPECTAYDGTGSPCATRKILDERSVRGDAPAPAAASSGAAGSNLEDAPAEHPTDRPRLQKLLDQLSRRTITASGAVELTGLCEALLRSAPADAPAEPLRGRNRGKRG